ncbi:YceK/YidQ family lipoprotein [Pseudomonas palleroniana]|uniref:YceK/YidQ family lipoprotein n=1 Tax=Pseudomonas palleroniana TaxID=191390 RepID=UPI00398FC227
MCFQVFKWVICRACAAHPTSTRTLPGMDLPASAVLDTLLLPLSGSSKPHKTIVGGGLLPIAVCQSAYL